MYQQTIRELLAKTGNIGIDPRHIEGFMRLEHPTLDGLSKTQFRQEVEISVECVKQSHFQECENLAQSLRLY